MKLFGLLLALFATSALGAGRVFNDDFEGTLNPQWSHVDSYNPCVIVGASVDGAPPYSGTKQLECNWNGVVNWGDPASHSTLAISSSVYPYTREFFIRFWARLATDVSNIDGNYFYIYPYHWENTALTPETTNALMIALCAYTCVPRFGLNWNIEGSTGDGSVAGGYGPDWYGTWYYYDGTIWIDNREIATIGNFCQNNPACPTTGPTPQDHQWHEYEIYLKTNTPGNQDGTARFWYDHNRIISVDSDTTVNPGAIWGPIELLMMASGSFGANNHVYFDNFAVYTDQGTGAMGSMADASIVQPSSCQ